jgi:hypothetical protein
MHTTMLDLSFASLAPTFAHIRSHFLVRPQLLILA